MSLDQAKVRELFAFPGERSGKPVIELRALTHGIPPKAVANNLNLFFKEWATSGVDAWNELKESGSVFLVGDETTGERARAVGWWNLPEVLGDRFVSRLLGTAPGSCIMMLNATQVVFSILSCQELNRSGKRKVICTDGEFPSVLHTVRNFNKQFSGYGSQTQKDVCLDIEMLSFADRAVDSRRIIESIDDQTAIVFISHVGFVRGERLGDAELKAIADKAHKHGALFAIDGYHALGGRPINVEATGADLYFGGLLKEGCGSSGACFLYIRPGLNLTPCYSGWFADAQPFAFAVTPEVNPSVRRRFLLGTTNVASYYHAVEGAKIMLQLGLQNVGHDSIAKVSKITGALSKAGIRIVSPVDPARASSLIVLEVPEADKFRDYIIRHFNIMVDARRNKFIRMAPHIYNSPQELEFTAATIAEEYASARYLSEAPIEKRGGPVT